MEVAYTKKQSKLLFDKTTHICQRSWNISAVVFKGVKTREAVNGNLLEFKGRKQNSYSQLKAQGYGLKSESELWVITGYETVA